MPAAQATDRHDMFNVGVAGGAWGRPPPWMSPRGEPYPAVFKFALRTLYLRKQTRKQPSQKHNERLYRP